MKTTLSVSAIKEGTVIDHIQARCALKIIRLLPLSDPDLCVTVGLNLKSASMGLKDIIKIENVFLTESDTAQIALFSPAATVNVICNFKVAQKYKVRLPQEVKSILICPNIRCITRIDSHPTRFAILESHGRVRLRCAFCERIFSRDDLQENERS